MTPAGKKALPSLGYPWGPPVNTHFIITVRDTGPFLSGMRMPTGAEIWLGFTVALTATLPGVRTSCGKWRRGNRLHPAGRGSECKPNPSNPPREGLKDFPPLRNEKARLRGLLLSGGGGSPAPNCLRLLA